MLNVLFYIRRRLASSVERRVCIRDGPSSILVGVPFLLYIMRLEVFKIHEVLKLFKCMIKVLFHVRRPVSLMGRAQGL